MIQGYSPVVQALLGTLVTWGLTAAGAAVVIIIRGSQRKLLDGSLGFAAGVMTAASFWSLLAPAIDMAAESKNYGANGEYAFVPVGFGFLFGALFVFGADILITRMGISSPNMMLALHSSNRNLKDRRLSVAKDGVLSPESTAIDGYYTSENSHQRRRVGKSVKRDIEFAEVEIPTQSLDDPTIEEIQHGQWKRILLLVIAITVHNIPEGLAVGVAFAATGSSPSATFQNARNLAVGIGIQNFPEGLAVSLPLQAAGFSTWKSLWYGQLSGMVEPIFGVLGALAVGLAQPALPYALAFAAGAMIYVVIDDIIPEANMNGNGKLATWGAVVGFLVMMTLDVGFA